jgi:pilus assembly protein CpaB
MKFSIHRSWLILAVALAVGITAAYGVSRYLKLQMNDIEARGKSKKMVRVLVSKTDLAKGAELSTALVAVREIPAEWSHSNAISPDQFDRVESQKLAYPAMHGEALLWSMLEGERAPTFSSRLASGRRAITVPVDEVNSISGMVQPGDHIDLMVSAKRDSKTYLFPLLQNVMVLAAGTRAVPEADGKDGRRSFTTITLDASPTEAQLLLAAREVGKIAALLRAPGDKAIAAATRRDALGLLGLRDAGGEPDSGSVPVIYGGGKLREVPRLNP